MARVHLEDASPAFPVGRVHDDATVEPPGPEQGGVEDLGSVGGGQHDDALVAGEAVHLGEDLVERLLALVVTAEVDRAAAGPTDRVELVDEDDRRRDLLGLLEQVAHPARADADDHLDELRRRDRQERDRGLAGDRSGQQRLAGARSTGEQHSAGDLRAEPPEPIRVPEEVDDLHDLGLDLVDPGDVFEGRPAARFRLVQARPRASEAAESGTRGSHPAAEQPHEQADDQQRRYEGEDEIGPRRAGRRRLGGDLHAAVQELLHEMVVGERRTLGLEVLHLAWRNRPSAG